MTVFVTKDGRKVNVNDGMAEVVHSWSSETPRRPKYHFAWEQGAGPTDYPEACGGDQDMAELTDDPHGEAERLWRQEYEEQFVD